MDAGTEVGGTGVSCRGGRPHLDHRDILLLLLLLLLLLKYTVIQINLMINFI